MDSDSDAPEQVNIKVAKEIRELKCSEDSIKKVTNLLSP